MSHPAVSAPSDPSSLIGSQLETYQTLVGMGFAQPESLNVAQIFGSNVEGAINCLFNADNMQPEFNFTGASMAESADSITPQATNDNPLLLPRMKPIIEEEFIQFRTTSLSHILMAGYIHNEEIHYHIPTVINDLIIQYFNLYFIKLNYNIHNDPLPIHEIDETDEKYTDPPSRDSDSDFSDEDIIFPFTMNVFVVKSTDLTLRELAIELERSYKYHYDDIMNSSEYFNCKQYQYFVHLWIKFRFMKAIYPLDNKHMKISIDTINAYEHEHDYDENRWVEIPNDFEEIKITEIDTIFAASANDNNSVLELGIETFDQILKKWPFRNPIMVPNAHEIFVKPATKKDQKFSLINIMPEKLGDLLSAAHNRLNIRAPIDWKCAFCGRENDKTYVFCAGCFKDKPQTEQNELIAAAPAPAPLPVIAPLPPLVASISAPLAPVSTAAAIAPDANRAHTPPTLAAAVAFTPPTLEARARVLLPPLLAAANPPLVPLPTLESKPARSRSLSPIPAQIIVPNPPCLEWIKHLKIGDIVDVKDEQDKWYESVIRFIESNGEKKVLCLHYIGWNKKWDEALPAQDINRIAKRNSHTFGPHRPKRTQYSTKPRGAYPYFTYLLSQKV